MILKAFIRNPLFKKNKAVQIFLILEGENKIRVKLEIVLKLKIKIKIALVIVKEKKNIELINNYNKNKKYVKTVKYFEIF